MNISNKSIASLLRNVAVAYQILGENRFRTNAYIQAAESIEQQSTPVQDLWKKGELQTISGVGGTIAQHLAELFKRGESTHFTEYLNKMPSGMFDLMKIRSVGPKNAYKLSTFLNTDSYDQNVSIYDRLHNALESHAVQKLDGFGEKKEKELARALQLYKTGVTKKKRLLLSEADAIVEELRAYVSTDTNIVQLEFLGSYRRRKETIGDIDIAVATTNTEETIQKFVQYNQMQSIVDKGDKGATILLLNDVQVDMRVIDPSRFGSMLQYFTGSKYHNIRIREHALKNGYSVNEWGITPINRSNKRSKNTIQTYSNEKNFYHALNLAWVPPELREDRGEVAHAVKKTLPDLVELEDIKGDLHIHTNFDFPTSHDLGSSSLEEIAKTAHGLGYEYIGIADHNPKQKGLTVTDSIDITQKRRTYIENNNSTNKAKKYKIKKVYNMYEVDIKPNGELALPVEAISYIDALVVSIHSSFQQTSEDMTKRILTALSSPKVRIFGHPTGRLINKRESIHADWDTIFAYCRKKSIALEINASPQRLDLPDSLAKQAIEAGCKLVINTDSHHADHLPAMRYGVSVARRAWATKGDILNTLPFEDFDKWICGNHKE